MNPCWKLQRNHFREWQILRCFEFLKPKNIMTFLFFQISCRYLFSIKTVINKAPSGGGKDAISPGRVDGMPFRFFSGWQIYSPENEQVLYKKGLHPGRLTWNLKMMVWKMIFLFNWVIFRFHVHLPGCISIGNTSSNHQGVRIQEQKETRISANLSYCGRNPAPPGMYKALKIMG